MAKRRRAKKPARMESQPAPQRAPWNPLQGRLWGVLLATVAIVFYWPALVSPHASIQWDAVDTHYSPQKYFADHLRRGELPFWTPYLFSGFPFLADPQVGAWYPLNWPFFLLGITPRAIQWELVLHAFLGCAGAYLLLRRLAEHETAALVGACAYGLSGFFAGHASHVGIFQAASWLPWLLLLLRRAREANFLRFAVVGGLVGGMMVLAGHFQTALYAFGGLGLFAVGELVVRRKDWARIVGFVAVTLAVAFVVSAVQTLPGLELTGQSIRAGAAYSDSREGLLEPPSLLTVMYPDALGVISGKYAGPGDVTQYYFYAGVLLLPLALVGLHDARARLAALLLIVPAAWYMLGPVPGLSRLGVWLPGFHKVRAPIHGWFVPALGLAVLAAAGARWVMERWKWRPLGLLLSTVFLLDLCYFNSWTNPLAYARAGFEDLYGNALEVTRSSIASRMPPLSRVEAPERLTALGPLNHPLDLGLEATYGYNPLKLAAYDEYLQAANANPKLRDGLNVSRWLDLEARAVRENPSCLPRVHFPREIVEAASPPEARRLLGSLEPARQAILTKPPPPIQQDSQATAAIVSYGEQDYRIRYRATSPSLLRLSVPYYPGWQARVAGSECPVVRVDHALMGVIVPPGDHELALRFRSRRFVLGASLSAFGVLAAAVLLCWRRGRA